MSLDLFQQLKAKSSISQRMKHPLNYCNGALMMLLVLSSETSQRNTKFPSLKPLPAQSVAGEGKKACQGCYRVCSSGSILQVQI